MIHEGAHVCGRRETARMCTKQGTVDERGAQRTATGSSAQLPNVRCCKLVSLYKEG
jgi:hypothetical protein